MLIVKSGGDPWPVCEAKLLLKHVTDGVLQNVRRVNGVHHLHPVYVSYELNGIHVLVPLYSLNWVVNCLNYLVHCVPTVEHVLCLEQWEVLEVLVSFL